MTTATATLNVEQEYQKCAGSFWYFATHYVYVLNPQEGGVIKFRPWVHQKQLVGLIMQNDRIIVLKARQLGVSWVMAAYGLWLCLFRPGSNILIFSIRQKEAVEMKNRAKFIWRNLPDFLRLPVGQDNDEMLTFPTMDSKIQSFPATEGSGRGETGSLVIMDEFAFMEYARTLYTSVMPTVERGKVVVISTANGKGNMFYELYAGAKAGENSFIPVFIPYNALPHRNRKTWEAAAADMPQYMAYQEYPWREQEAFLVGGTCMFNVDALQAMPIWKAEGLLGNAEIYVPYTPDHTYSAGVDTALGIAKRDFSVLNIIDDETYDVVAKLRGIDRLSGQRIPIEEFSHQSFDLLETYGFPKVGVEEQPQGRTVYRIFKERKYPMSRFYHRSKNIPCWHSNEATRRNVLGELEAAIRTQVMKIHSDDTVSEMLGFGYDEKKDKFVGLSGNDDEVLSLAIANKMHVDRPPAWDADAFKPMDYISSPGGIVGGEFILPTQLNWQKRDPMAGLEAIICPTCLGERRIEANDGTSVTCLTCYGLAEVLRRVAN